MVKKKFKVKIPMEGVEAVVLFIRRQGLTFGEFAKKANIHQSYLSDLLHGKRIPSDVMAHQICAAIQKINGGTLPEGISPRRIKFGDQDAMPSLKGKLT